MGNSSADRAWVVDAVRIIEADSTGQSTRTFASARNSSTTELAGQTESPIWPPYVSPPSRHGARRLLEPTVSRFSSPHLGGERLFNRGLRNPKLSRNDRRLDPGREGGTHGIRLPEC